MKNFLFPILVLAALAVTGCDSLPSGSGGRLGPPPETKRVFQGEPRAVYSAARVALAKMEFRVTGGGPAAGRIEAVSGLSPADNMSGARQITLSVRITPVLDGGCEVAAELKEAIEEDAGQRPGFATQTILRDTPYYEVFFNGLAQALAAPQKD